MRSMIYRYGIAGIIGVLALALTFACDSPSGPGGNAGSHIAAMFPANRAQNQDLGLTLRWTYTDSTDTAVRFDVSLGTAAHPPLAADGLRETHFAPGFLDQNTVYYWQVTAEDSTGMLARSPIMSFCTRKAGGNEFTYPLAVGDRWEYRYTSIGFNYRPDSLRYYYPWNYTGAATVEIVRPDTLGDTLVTYVFHTSMAINDTVYESDHYMNNTADGFYLYAYNNSNMVAPTKSWLRSKGGLNIYAGLGVPGGPVDLDWAFNDGLSGGPGPGDSLYYESPPVQSLAYPLDVGRQWTVREHNPSGLPWRIDKKIVDYGPQRVPAGTFDCFTIQWLWDIDNDGNWDTGYEGYDYVAPQGLIKRVIIVHDLFATSYNGPSGLFDVIETIELTDLNVR